MKVRHGRQKQLADAAGVSVTQLCDIMNGRKRCPSTLAVKLEQISEQVLGTKIYSTEWILAGLGFRKEMADDHGIAETEAGN